MEKLLFKLQYTVRGLMIPTKVDYIFEFGGPHDIKVLLRSPSVEELSKGYNASNAFCTSSCSVEPNEGILNIFRKITTNQIIQEGNSTDISREYTTPEGLVIRIPALSYFTENFRSFMTNIRKELRDCIIRTVSVLRWRENVQGPHNPFGTIGLSWSTDGLFWHPAPADFGIQVSTLGPIHPSKESLTQIEDIVKTSINEPLYHDLFREAWAQRYDNPRSALVIGIAAAEISIKRCISILVPNADWLATNLSTPPLVRMITEYLPKLPTKNKIKDKVKPLPKEILDILNKGVTMRNQLSHAGSVNPSGETVEEVLEAIQDLLWLIDFYLGFDWAFEYLRPATKAGLLSS